MRAHPGHLKMYNTTFTVDDYCHTGNNEYDVECNGMMWQGVDVYGHPNSYQNLKNGSIEMYENSVIENAYTGVRLGNNNSNAGGYILTNHATFRNNKVDVDFASFTHYSFGMLSANMSNFEFTDFIVDKQLNDPSITLLEYRVKLYDVDGIYFTQCDFSIEGEGLNSYDLSSRGRGLYSLFSSFSIKGICPYYSPPTVCDEFDITAEFLGTAQSEITPSSFNNFKTGVLAFGAGAYITPSIKQTIFFKNQQGIVFVNVDRSEIFKCKFDIPVGSQYHLGAAIINSTGYTVERNYFNGTSTLPSASNYNVGVIIKNSGPYSNEIYLNDFRNLFIGTQVEGENQGQSSDAKDFIGLEVLCGLYDNTPYDIVLLGEDVTVSNRQGENINPAGNIFEGNSWGNDNNIYIDTDSDAFMIYLHHNESQSTENVEPDYISSTVYKFPTGIPFTTRLASCPSYLKLSKSQYVEKVEEKRDAINSLTENLSQVMDGGNTEY